MVGIAAWGRTLRRKALSRFLATASFLSMKHRHLKKKVRRLEAEKRALLRELFALQKFCNEVAARAAINGREAL